MVCLNEGNILFSSGSICCTSYRNEMEKVLSVFIFENFIKEIKFPVTTTKLEGL